MLYHCSTTSMRTLETAYFGQLEYADDSVVHFPEGLPGFEQEKAFAFIRTPNAEPLIFMQSMASPQLCFLLLPVFVVCPSYRLHLASEDLGKLALPCGREPRIGVDVLCGVIVCSGNTEGPTVNLLGPIVVNLQARIGMQAIQNEAGFSHQYPLFPAEVAVSCS